MVRITHAKPVMGRPRKEPFARASRGRLWLSSALADHLRRYDCVSLGVTDKGLALIASQDGYQIVRPIGGNDAYIGCKKFLQDAGVEEGDCLTLQEVTTTHGRLCLLVGIKS